MASPRTGALTSSFSSVFCSLFPLRYAGNSFSTTLLSTYRSTCQWTIHHNHTPTKHHRQPILPPPPPTHLKSLPSALDENVDEAWFQENLHITAWQPTFTWPQNTSGCQFCQRRTRFPRLCTLHQPILHTSHRLHTLQCPDFAPAFPHIHTDHDMPHSCSHLIQTTPPSPIATACSLSTFVTSSLLVVPPTNRFEAHYATSPSNSSNTPGTKSTTLPPTALGFLSTRYADNPFILLTTLAQILRTPGRTTGRACRQSPPRFSHLRHPNGTSLISSSLPWQIRRYTSPGSIHCAFHNL